MIPTRRPRRSTSWFHRAVCMTVPEKVSRPGISGALGWVRMPVAPTMKRAVTSSPSAVARRQTWRCSSNVAAVTVVLRRMRERKP